MARKKISVSKAAARELRRGHPWIWDRAVLDVGGEPGAGDAVAIVCGKDLLGYGFYDPNSPIRARRLGRRKLETEWIAARIDRALDLRSRSISLTGTNAMRLVHGEGDGAAGLVIDRYDSVAAVRFDGDAAEAFWRPFLEVIFERLSSVGVRSLFIRGEGIVLGEPAQEALTVFEDDAVFEVDLVNGQKTGLFLDQRPHRRRVRALASSSRVLNLCSYTGGFSVHAALGGAREVTSVDVAAPAIEACRRNFEHSGIDPANHQFIAADVFEFLSAKRNQNAYELVICDPPSFAPRRSAVGKATRAYTSLNRLAVGAVKRGGILITASCSSHIDRPSFIEAVAAGVVRSRRLAQMISSDGPGADHPSRPGFPEGDYLKVLTLAVAQ